MRLLGLVVVYGLCLWSINFCDAYPEQSCRDRLDDTCTGDTNSNYILDELSEFARQLRHKETLAEWTYNTNVTKANQEATIAIASDNAVAKKQLALKIKNLGYADNLEDEVLRREAKYLSIIGHSSLADDDYKELSNAIASMQTNYATATVCSFEDPTNCKLTLEPHIQDRLAKSRDPKELTHYWKEWHDTAGTPMREHFATYVRLANKAARLNNFSNYADYWIHFYEDSNFEDNLDATFNKILPLYRQLHAYVRFRLGKHYGVDVVPPTGNIPMHLLGNMWAQQWHDVIDLFLPYPEKPFIDITKEMRNQNYTVRKIFELGDEFFQSIGMKPLPASFWDLSMLERPSDRSVVCHASAWDFYQDSDVRIKMCTEVDSHYFFVVHHELGHIQYYLQYEHQPTSLRGAPNPGFHEAVGDVIGLSVVSPKHLHKIGLLEEGELDEKTRINELFKMALQKIIFLPFAYTLDKYRLAIFRGEIEPSKWNCGFWQMRSEFSGIEPPIKRSDDDFDPPAKYHIDADVEYLRYFAAHIFQFQFHKAMCTISGQFERGNSKKTLDNCDIFHSKDAGAAFSKFLAAGASKHWKEILEEFTGDTIMDPGPLLEYFQPLTDWLKEENKRLGVPIGWDATTKVAEDCCPPFST